MKKSIIKVKTVFLETGQFRLDDFDDVTAENFSELSGSIIFVESVKEVFYVERNKRAGAAILVKLPGIVIADYFLEGIIDKKVKQEISDAANKQNSEKLPLYIN